MVTERGNRARKDELWNETYDAAPAKMKTSDVEKTHVPAIGLLLCLFQDVGVLFVEIRRNRLFDFLELSLARFDIRKVRIITAPDFILEVLFGNDVAEQLVFAQLDDVGSHGEM